MFDAKKVIAYIESRGLVFPREQLKVENTVVAGGAVANAILSLYERKDYPVSDVDFFVWQPPAKREDLVQEEVVTAQVNMFPTGYPEFLANRLQILHRKSDSGLDRIYCTVKDESKNPVYMRTEDFVRIVVDSFDLNCVQAAIYYDNKRDIFKVYVLPEFVKFLNHKKVKIVNVHAVVTFARAEKKANDLGATFNRVEECEIVKAAFNHARLNGMTTEQYEKHKEYFYALAQSISIITAPRNADQDAFYEFFGMLDKLNLRQHKIRILRAFYEGSVWQKLNITRLLKLGSERLFQLMLLNEDILEWVGDSVFNVETREQLTGFVRFITKYDNILFFFVEMPLEQALKRYRALERIECVYGEDFILTHLGAILSWTVPMYAREEVLKKLPHSEDMFLQVLTLAKFNFAQYKEYKDE